MKKITSILMVLALVISLLPVSTNAASKELIVHFIDVGQGDAILIQSPNGKDMLVDEVQNRQGSTLWNFKRKRR